jgi:membrane fusion protein, multidrug efflux system
MHKIAKITIISLISIAVVGSSAYIVYKRLQQKNDLAVAQKIQNDIKAKQESKILKLKDTDITITEEANFIEELDISGLFIPIERSQAKAKTSGEISNLNIKDGDFVSKGQILAKVTNIDVSSRIEQSQAQIDASKQQLELAKSQYTRYKELSDQGFISLNALDNYKSALNIASSNFNSAVAGHKINQKTQIDTAIHAPISGIVINKKVHNGEKISPDMPILEIVDISELELESGISSDNINKIKPSQEVKINIGNNIDDKITGHISRISAISSANRLINVYTKIDNIDNKLKSGSFAKGKIILNEQVYSSVPETAIIYKYQKPPMVYWIDNSNNKLVKYEFNNPIISYNGRVAIDIPVGAKVVNIPISNIQDIETAVILKTD